MSRKKFTGAKGLILSICMVCAASLTCSVANSMTIIYEAATTLVGHKPPPPPPMTLQSCQQSCDSVADLFGAAEIQYDYWYVNCLNTCKDDYPIVHPAGA